MLVAIHTLGCKVNQYETAALEGLLRERGHRLVPFEGTADAYIINTCTVTAVSDKKSRQAIRRAQKRSPRAVVAVCGCYAQTAPEAVAELGVDLVAGSADRVKFVDNLEKMWGDRGTVLLSSGTKEPSPCLKEPSPCLKEPSPCLKEPSPCLEAAARAKTEEHAPVLTVDDIMTHRIFEPLTADGLEGRTRAYLKVEDGCVNFCSYCIIPYARGPVRSLPLAEVVAQAKRLVAEGYKELVLTGIEISSWGNDLKEGADITDLVEAVCAAAPTLRLRLGSLEPRTVTEDFCARLAKYKNLCPQFHLSMQSGCDTVLKRMNRKYDTERYYESVRLLRVYYKDPGITTDLIVGFPGETEEEFSETLAFVDKCAFSAMHIFPYSRRTGTPAAKLPGQILNAVKEERAHRAAALAATLEAAYLSRWVGKTMDVLFEDEKEGLWRGHTPNYLEVRAPGEDLHNQVCAVTLTAAHETHLDGVCRG